MDSIVITRVLRNGKWNKTMEQARFEALRQAPTSMWSTLGRGKIIGEVTEEFGGTSQTSQGISYPIESIYA